MTHSSRPLLQFRGIYQAAGPQLSEDSNLVRHKINISNLSIRIE
jgi:hypothetical protein